MSERDESVFLQDILNSIEKIERFSAGLGFDEFVKNEMAVDAVIRNFEIIGEAAVHISEETKSKNPKIPWEKMKSMRNLLIHEYFGVDFEIMWKTIKESLPELKRELLKTTKNQ